MRQKGAVPWSRTTDHIYYKDDDVVATYYYGYTMKKIQVNLFFRLPRTRRETKRRHRKEARGVQKKKKLYPYLQL